MTSLYFSLAAIHILAIVVTGILWLIIDFNPKLKLHKHVKIIRGVHFGSLFVVPMILGLAFAFDRLQVPAWHRGFFPVGMELLFILGVGASLFPLTPRRASVGPDYPWSHNVARMFGKIALAGLVIGFTWTAVVLFLYAAVR